MDILAQTKKACREYGIRPARSKGQNFLIRHKAYDRMVARADIEPADTVVEIGPGLGFLTQALAQKARRVIAVELDGTLAAALHERLAAAGVGNVEIVHEDVLKLQIADFKLQHEHYTVVANLPYNITSRVMRKFLSETDPQPRLMVLMVQKEVAERITAQPPQMSLLGVSAQLYADVQYAYTVPAAVFWPRPQVDSAVVTLRIFPATVASTDALPTEKVVQLAKIGFTQKRKTLANNLKDGLGAPRAAVEAAIAASGVPAQARAQELSLDNWRELFVVLRARNMV